LSRLVLRGGVTTIGNEELGGCERILRRHFKGHQVVRNDLDVIDLMRRDNGMLVILGNESIEDLVHDLDLLACLGKHL